jgi:hypothetical protein
MPKRLRLGVRWRAGIRTTFESPIGYRAGARGSSGAGAGDETRTRDINLREMIELRFPDFVFEANSTAEMENHTAGSKNVPNRSSISRRTFSLHPGEVLHCRAIG